MEVKQEQISPLFTTSDVISICAAIIALCALAISIWQGVLARRHNQTSVRPLLDFVSSKIKGDDIQVILLNHGVGPALFKSMKFFHGNSAFTVSSYSDYQSLFSSLGIDLQSIVHRVVTLTESSALFHGKEVVLLEFKGAKVDQQLHEKLHKVLDQLTIEIKYECIYGNPHTLTTKL